MNPQPVSLADELRKLEQKWRTEAVNLPNAHGVIISRKAAELSALLARHAVTEPQVGVNVDGLTLEEENALVQFVDLVLPDLDSGDVVEDARKAMLAIIEGKVKLLHAPAHAVAEPLGESLEVRRKRAIELAKEYQERTGKGPGDQWYAHAWMCGYFNHPGASSKSLNTTIIEQFEASAHAPEQPKLTEAAVLLCDSVQKFLNEEGGPDNTTNRVALRISLVRARRELTLLPSPVAPPPRREMYHEAIEKVLNMRRADLANAQSIPSEKEYYLGRAHRCDDILFWLGHIEAKLPAGESQ